MRGVLAARRRDDPAERLSGGTGKAAGGAGAARVADRRYNEQDPAAALDRFTRERAESLRQLRELGDLAKVDWTRAYQHPKVGPVPAGEVLAAWTGHDALHLRQIAKRLWELAGRDGSPYPTKYAGEWKA